MQGSSSLKRKRDAAQDVTQNNNKLTPIEPYSQPTSNLTLPLQSPLPDLPCMLTLDNLEIQGALEIKRDLPTRGDPVPGLQLVSASSIPFLSVRIKWR